MAGPLAVATALSMSATTLGACDSIRGEGPPTNPSAATDGGADRESGKARAENATADASGPLTGKTRILFVKDNVPYVTDELGAVRAPVTSVPFFTIYGATLGRDGRWFAACAAARSTGDALFAGPVGAVTEVFDPPGTFCKEASSDGTVIAWVEYGTGVVPHNRLRFMDGNARPLPGDGVRGSVQLWHPTLLDDRRVLAIEGESSDIGPLVIYDRLDADAGLGGRRVSTERMRTPFDLSPVGVVVGAYGSAVFVVDLVAGDERRVFQFPGAPPTCDTSAPDTAKGCFLHAESPALSPDGTRIAFIGRGIPGLTPDTDGDVYVLDLASDVLTRVTDDTVPDARPRFTADGQSVIFLRTGVGLVWAPSSGGAAPTPLIAGDLSPILEVAWPEVAWATF